MKSLSVGSDPDGGYTVLPVMSSEMIRRLFDQSPMRRLARIEVMPKGDAFEEITDPNDVEASWVATGLDRCRLFDEDWGLNLGLSHE